MRIDRIFLLGHRNDLRFTRCCVASIRRWYPDIPISLIKDELLGGYDTSELEKYWNVEIFPTPVKRFGWGLARLEALFLPARERALILDSDIVLAGRVLDSLEEYDEDFIVEGSNYPPEEIKAYYFDLDLLGRLYPLFEFAGYVFNAGQMVATTGILRREFFAAFVAFEEPRRILRPDVFVGSEQSLLNFILPQRAQQAELSIRRHAFMRWAPGMQDSEVRLERLQEGSGYDFLIHWAGPKNPDITKSPMSHVLKHFEAAYYQRTIPRKLKDKPSE